MAEDPSASMNAFVKDALTKIYKQSARKHKNLRRAITQVFEFMAKLTPQQFGMPSFYCWQTLLKITSLF